MEKIKCPDCGAIVLTVAGFIVRHTSKCDGRWDVCKSSLALYRMPVLKRR